MDGDISFPCGHRHKRTHGQMEGEGSSSPSHPYVSNLQLPHIANMAQPQRYPGDGLDFRRPVSLSRNDIIDLTEDDAGGPSNNRPPMPRVQRPPRFARDIITIDDEDTPPRRSAVPPPDSPEIEFISSRRIDPPPHQDPPIRADENDDVEILRSHTVPGAQRQRDWGIGAMLAMANVFGDDGYPPRGRFAHLRQQIERVAGMRPPQPPPRGGRTAAQRIRYGFVRPDMDFHMVGFDMGMEGGPAAPAPTYEAPAAAPEGFTRAPTENEPYICPNCERELCTGDSELQKQVWIVKGCGHIYCGECTANRSVKKSAKGKERITPANHKPFKTCVVDGCDKKTHTPKSMIQVFL